MEVEAGGTEDAVAAAPEAPAAGDAAPKKRKKRKKVDLCVPEEDMWYNRIQQKAVGEELPKGVSVVVALEKGVTRVNFSELIRAAAPAVAPSADAAGKKAAGAPTRHYDVFWTKLDEMEGRLRRTGNLFEGSWAATRYADDEEAADFLDDEADGCGESLLGGAIVPSLGFYPAGASLDPDDTDAEEEEEPGAKRAKGSEVVDLEGSDGSPHPEREGSRVKAEVEEERDDEGDRSAASNVVVPTDLEYRDRVVARMPSLSAKALAVWRCLCGEAASKGSAAAGKAVVLASLARRARTKELLKVAFPEGTAGQLREPVLELHAAQLVVAVSASGVVTGELPASAEVLAACVPVELEVLEDLGNYHAGCVFPDFRAFRMEDFVERVDAKAGPGAGAGARFARQPLPAARAPQSGQARPAR